MSAHTLNQEAEVTERSVPHNPLREHAPKTQGPPIRFYALSFKIYFMSMSAFACIYVCASIVCLVPSVVRGGYQMPWN